MTTVRPGWLHASRQVPRSEKGSWRFKGGLQGLWQNHGGWRVRCALLGCRLDGTWPGVGIDGDEAVEVEAASMISRAVRVSEVEVGVSRERVLDMGERGSAV
jgi:hypothetical protein